MADFVEVADRVWVARYDWCDANVTVVAGGEGLLVVDTHGSTAGGHRVIDDIGRLGLGQVTTVVNTHWHFDHSFGNEAFRTVFGAVPIYAHEDAERALREWGPHVRAAGAGQEPPYDEEVRSTALALPDQTFSSVAVIDVGGRQVELVHPGRGHTGGDLVVRIPDADALLAGDLVEESGPPSFNTDAYPLDWPATLDFVVQLLGPSTLVIPGHGAVVDRAFVETQRDELAAVAETIRELAARGVSVDAALDAGAWPYPHEHLRDAVQVGYQHLRPQDRRLPLA